MSDFLINLVDGGIKNIRTDEDYIKGCETCDFGSIYISEMIIYMTKYTIYSKIGQMYEYAINVDDTLKLFLPNINEIVKMTEEEFIEWYKEWFYQKSNEDNIKFNVKEVEDYNE